MSVVSIVSTAAGRLPVLHKSQASQNEEWGARRVGRAPRLDKSGIVQVEFTRLFFTGPKARSHSGRKSVSQFARRKSASPLRNSVKQARESSLKEVLSFQRLKIERKSAQGTSLPSIRKPALRQAVASHM